MNLKIQKFFESEFTQIAIVYVISTTIVYCFLNFPKADMPEGYKPWFMMAHCFSGLLVFLMSRDVSKVILSSFYSILCIFSITIGPIIVARFL